MTKMIKERLCLTYIPEWNNNKEKKERDQIKVCYRPATLGEFEAYASNRETQVYRLFKNHVTFENLRDSQTKAEIKTGEELMDSTDARLRTLLIEITTWIFSQSILDPDEEKN